MLSVVMCELVKMLSDNHASTNAYDKTTNQFISPALYLTTLLQQVHVNFQDLPTQWHSPTSQQYYKCSLLFLIRLYVCLGLKHFHMVRPFIFTIGKLCQDKEEYGIINANYIPQFAGHQQHTICIFHGSILVVAMAIENDSVATRIISLTYRIQSNRRPVRGKHD